MFDRGDSLTFWTVCVVDTHTDQRLMIVLLPSEPVECSGIDRRLLSSTE